MKKSRNPFRTRYSQIDSAEAFIRLFSPGVLDLLKNKEIWNKPLIFRSAPGGGKTSLLHLFTPHLLVTLQALQNQEESQELFQRLKELEAIDENEIKVLGIFVSFYNQQKYANLEDLEDLEPAIKNRLFLTRLNALIVLEAIQSAMAFKNLKYPDEADLETIEISSVALAEPSIGLPVPCSGKDLYDWACKLEKNVNDFANSFSFPTGINPPKFDSLIALSIIRPECIKYKGIPIAERVLFMFDDVQSLTANQRSFLLQEIVDSRASTGIWVAERLQALDVNELLSPGAKQGRDYEDIIYLEDFWRSPEHKKRFLEVVTNIADRRVREAADVEINSFAECLQDSLDETKWQDKFVEAGNIVAERVRERAAKQPQYADLMATQDKQIGSFTEIAIAWQTLDILLERQERNSKLLFDIEQRIDRAEKRTDVRKAAELFLSREFQIPYYYSLRQLAIMASSNIDQFLSLAGDIFEEAAAAAILKQNYQLTPERQEKILKQAIKERWDKLPQEVPYGREVKQFLQFMGDFARRITYEPNAPYAPGVTGIGIALSDIKILKNNPHLPLARVLSNCVAYHLLNGNIVSRQNTDWMQLNLNRMLCVHFALPLQYGGWRPQTLKTLETWVEPIKQLELKL